MLLTLSRRYGVQGMGVSLTVFQLATRLSRGFLGVALCLAFLCGAVAACYVGGMLLFVQTCAHGQHGPSRCAGGGLVVFRMPSYFV